MRLSKEDAEKFLTQAAGNMTRAAKLAGVSRDVMVGCRNRYNLRAGPPGRPKDIVLPKKYDWERIKELYENGSSLSATARQVGCSQFAVYNALRAQECHIRSREETRRSRWRVKLGFPPDKVPLEVALSEFSNNVYHMAAYYNVEYISLLLLLKRVGVHVERYKGRLYTKPEPFPVQEAIELSKAGASNSEIALRYKVQVSVVGWWFRKAGYVRTPGSRRKYLLTKGNQRVTLSRKLLEELGHSCEVCGEPRTVDICHILPKKLGGLMIKENLLVLCPTHHRLFDRGLLTPEEKGKLVPRPQAKSP